MEPYFCDAEKSVLTGYEWQLIGRMPTHLCSAVGGCEVVCGGPMTVREGGVLLYVQAQFCACVCDLTEAKKRRDRQNQFCGRQSRRALNSIFRLAFALTAPVPIVQAETRQMRRGDRAGRPTLELTRAWRVAA